MLLNKNFFNELSNVKKIKSYLILVLILLFALALRLYHIDFQSLWNDELSSIMRSDFDNLALILKDWDEYGHPPGLYFFYFFWIKLFSNSELSIRIPSVIAGVLSVLFIYLLAKKIYSQKEAIISAIFTTILWCPIYFSQEARQYTFLILFSIIVSYLLLFIINRLKNNNYSNLRYYILYTLSAIFLSYMHYFGLLLVAIQLCYMLIIFSTKTKKIIHILILYSIIFIAYVPWLSTLIFYSNYDAVPHIPKPSPIDAVYFFEFLFNWSELLTKFIFFLYLYFFIYVIYYVFKNKLYGNYFTFLTQPEVILGLWLFIPFIIVYIRSEISTPILTYRSLLISLPPAYILLSRALIKLPFNIKINYLIVCVLISFLINDLFYNLDYYSKPTKNQFRESVKYIIDNNSKYQDNQILGYAWNLQYFNYYFKHFNSNLKIAEGVGLEKDTVILNNIIKRKSPKYIFFINIHRYPENEILKHFENNFKIIDFKEFIGGKVIIYENI